MTLTRPGDIGAAASWHLFGLVFFQFIFNTEIKIQPT